MGVVYEVIHELTRHRRALKTLNAKSKEQPQAVERFLREASAAGRIGSPHIVETYDAGTLDSGEPYLVMELLEGETLEARLTRKGLFDPEEIVAIFAQAAEGANAAHEAGIIHRDLKPENLFLAKTNDGMRVKPARLRRVDLRRAPPPRARDAGGHAARHAVLHVARAGARRDEARRAQRRLRARRDDARVRDRRAPVPRRDAARRDRERHRERSPRRSPSTSCPASPRRLAAVTHRAALEKNVDLRLPSARARRGARGPSRSSSASPASRFAPAVGPRRRRRGSWVRRRSARRCRRSACTACPRRG